MMTIQIKTAATRYYIVSCYLPWNNITTLAYVKKSWEQCPRGCTSLLIRDLYVDLDDPQDNDCRDEMILEQVCSDWHLTNVINHFKIRQATRSEIVLTGGHRRDGHGAWRERTSVSVVNLIIFSSVGKTERKWEEVDYEALDITTLIKRHEGIPATAPKVSNQNRNWAADATGIDVWRT